MRKLTVVAITAILTACASSGTQISQSKATSFTEGVSTEAEIVAALGKPTSVMIMGDMKYLSYSGFQYKTKAATFIPVVGLFAGGADVASTTASYSIDKAGILRKITYISSGTSSQNGYNPANMDEQKPKAIE